MRLGCLVAITLGCSLQLLMANTSHGQSMDSTTVAVGLKTQPLSTAISQIEKQTVFRFAYSKQLVNSYSGLFLTIRRRTVRQTLDELLRQTNLRYRQINDKIVLYPAPAPAIDAPGEPAAVIVPPVVMERSAPEIPTAVVKGRVLDDKTSEPIVNASVVIKGKKEGVSTNMKGEFLIETATGATLSITSVGYEKKEIVVGSNQANLVIRLTISTGSMTDVVVTGLFSRPAQNFTGAATVLTKEDLGKVTNNSLLSAISALDPSFQIPENINAGSNPNALPDVQLRGGNSIVNAAGSNTNDVFGYANNKVNTPLFILDGIEVSLQRVFDLDMNRIAKVTILKDAAATSIYGSRAANGVIIMETLTPKDGKLRISFNSNFSLEIPDLRDYDVLNATEKLDLELKGGVYKSNFNLEQERLNVLYAARKAEVERGVNTYWLSQPLRTSFGYKQNLYLEGGGNNMLYGVGLTFDTKNGVMKGSDRQNFQANAMLSYRRNNLTIRNDLQLYYNKANNSPYGSFYTYTALNPYYTPWDANGNMKYYLENLQYTNGQVGTGDQLATAITNPMYNGKLNVVDQTKYRGVMNTTNVIFQAFQWLRFNARVSVESKQDYNDKFLPANHTSFATLAATDFAKKGSYTKADGNVMKLDGSFTADLNKAIGRHLFFGTVGMNVLTNSSDFNIVSATGFPNETLNSFYNAIQYAASTRPLGFETRSRQAGYLGNLSYSYDNRYLLDLSYRLDGSSLFGSNKRFASFWSTGLGWNLHKEKFWNENKIINMLKLRYSVGYTGSQRFSSYLAMTTGQYYNDRQYNSQYGLYLLGYGNENLAWQQTQKSNYGTDILLFNRVSLRGNYFVEKTQGALATINTAPSTGFDSYQENMGDLINKGWEAYVNVTLLSRKRDNWNVFLNVFSSKGEYTRISNSLKELNKQADTSKSTVPLVRYAEGQSPTAIWAMQSKGIDPSNGREIFINRDGTLTNTYNTAQQVIVGDSRAKLEGTFGTSVEIKGIGMNLFFRFRVGGQTYNQTLADRVENVDIRNNVDRRVYLERWLKPGDHTYFKGLVNPEGYAIGTTPTYATSRFVQDYNYLSCESLSLYYRFSEGFNKKLNLSNTRVTFYTGQLFRVSTVKQERGLAYPYSQTFTFLLQTSF